MTRGDFESRFNALHDPNNPPTPESIVQFRMDALADYDNYSTMSTSVNTLNEKISNLEKENKELKETNYKLFLMTPGLFTPSDSNSDEKPDDTQTEEPEVEHLDAIVSDLFIKEGGN